MCMELKYISDLISELTQSLDVSLTSDVDWHNFLAILARYCGAESAILKCSIRKSVHYNKKNHEVDSINICTVFRLGYEDSYIGLSFISAGQYERAQAFLNQLQGQIQSVYKLGVLWQKQHQLQEVTNSFSYMKRMASVDIDEKGRPQRHSGIFTELLKSGALQLGTDGLQFSEDPSWIANAQKEMMLCQNDNQMAYRTFCVLSKHYRCVVNYNRNAGEGWWQVKHKFSLFFYESNDQIDLEGLKAMYSLSQPEAEIAILFSKGLSAEEVSNITGYAVSTIYSYLKNIYKVLNVNKQSQLTAMIMAEMPAQRFYESL